VSDNGSVPGTAEDVTLLFTDVVGSTQLWETAPTAMSKALARHDQILRSAIESAGGEVFKTMGDAFCAAFSAPSDALASALRTQLALAAEPWPQQLTLRVRIGIHSGPCERRDQDYFGPTVNRAARLQSVAHGGQVVVSAATASLLQAMLPEGVALRDLGEHRLKDLVRPERVFQLEADGLELRFPPLRSVDNPETGNNLPARLTRFVGRRHELSQTRELLARSRLVTLTGAGGCGKTSLAIEAASDLDGAWFVDLSSLGEEEQVAPRVLSVLGVRTLDGRPATDVLLEALSDRRIMIVLDNCEHVIGACAQLADAVLRSCKEIRILATSREPLGIEGEALYRVPSLSLPRGDTAIDVLVASDSEAVELFVERAVSHRPEFSLDEGNARAVVAICRRLDGIPLALELAATRIETFSLQELEANLDDRFRLLSKGTRTALPRHQTLRALVEWSYDLLVEAERAVLRRASVFAGGFTPVEARAVFAEGTVDPIELVDVLESLVQKNLIQLDEAAEPLVRYRLLETIRQFATEELVGHDEEAAARSAHAAAFLALAESASPHLWKEERLEWLARLNADRENLNAAVEYLLSEPSAGQAALRFVIAMSRYWEMTGQYTHVVEIGRALLTHPGTSEHDRLWVEAVAALALVWRGDNWELAVFEPEVREALEPARTLDLHEQTAVLLWVLAGHTMRRGELDVARGLEEQAVEAARRSGDPMTLGVTLIAASCVYESRTSEARARLVEAESCLRAAGDSYWHGVVVNNLASTDMDEGNLAAARRRLQEGLDLSRPGGDEVLTLLLANLGDLELREDNFHVAIEAYAEAAARQLRRGGLSHTSSGIVAGLAVCAAALGEIEAAAYLHGAAQSIQVHSGLEYGEQFVYLDADLLIADQKRLVTQMGEPRFEATFSRGLALTPRGALQAALEWARGR
jgi:predicted ATPase/class 3 adenylate cyclase